jgi:FMN phosphatase YigB (HAD superfamily)
VTVPAVVLWDFGDTLVDERWMRRTPPSCPTWESVWVETMDAMADDWNVGGLSARDVFRALAARSGLSIDEVEAHAIGCCRQLTFHRAAWRVATERRWPQALVTVNPDVFEDYVIPAYELDTVFDAIVTSCGDGTASKVRLCEIALDRLGYEGNRADVLLIDNRADLAQEWEESGGRGYWFRTDEQFARDLPTLILD